MAGSDAVQKKTVKKLKPCLVALGVSIALSGCGGGSSSPDDRVDPGNSDKQTISGVALDGYLASAEVCFDANANFQCDSGEPATQTNENGQFSLEIAKTDLAAGRVLVRAVAGKTRDLDAPETPLSKDFWLTSTPGKTSVISPITTMVEAYRLQSGSSVADAEQAISQQLQTANSSDVYLDLVASTDDDIKKLHLYGQVASDLIGKTYQESGASNWSAEKQAGAIRLAMQKVTAVALLSIKSQVDQKLSSGDLSLNQPMTPAQVTEVSTTVSQQKQSQLTISESDVDKVIAGGPVVNAGEDFSLIEGQQKTIQATSGGGDGHGIVSWQWQQVSGPTASLVGEQSNALTITAPSVSNAQVMVFALQATDTLGHQSLQDFVEVTVNPDPANLPQLTINAPVEADELTSLQISASAVASSGRTISQWQWRAVSPTDLSFTANNETAEITLPEVSDGSDNLTITLEVTVTDSVGSQVSKTVSVQVNPVFATPEAPQNLQINDATDTLNWDWVADYQTATDYEYSTDGGASWQAVSARPLNVGNVAIAANQLKLRVKADQSTHRNAGEEATNAHAFTIRPDAPAAPTNAVVNDASNRFGWQYTPGFNAATDYEISLDSGANWSEVSENPQAIPDENYPAGVIQVRVKADANTGRPAGSVLVSNVAFTATPATPAAPTAPVVDDVADTFGWSFVSGFENASDYEFSINSGASWNAVPSNPMPVTVESLAVNQLQVRVKANALNGRAAGAALGNDQPFTPTPGKPSAPTNPQQNDAENTFAWTWVAGFEQVADYQYTLDGGDNWQAVTSNPVNVGDVFIAAGKFQVRVVADADTGRPEGVPLLSVADFTVQPDAPAAPTNPQVNDAQNTFSWQLVDGFNQPADYEISLDSGGQWSSVTVIPANIPDQAYAAGAIQVRVKANAENGRPAGAILASDAEYTATPATPAAPANPQVDDANNRFGWDWVAGFTAADEYEISINNGQDWQAVASNPAQLADAALDAGFVQVRVKADSNSGRLAGAVLKSDAVYTVTPETPAAPTNGVVDDQANTFSWDLVSGFADLSSYEMKVADAAWQDATNPVAVGNVDLAAGALKIRVKADSQTGRLAGAELTNAQAFTEQTSTPLELAMIAGTPFAKLNAAGDFIAADTTIENGWRCVLDTRSGNQRVWSLMLDGAPNSTDNVPWSSDANRDAADILSELNSASVCGFNDWKAPSLYQLKDLATKDADGDLTLDPQVFPNHQPAHPDLVQYASYITPKLYYWSSEASGGYSQVAYTYKLTGDPAHDASQGSLDNDDDVATRYTVVLRAMRESDRFAYLAEDGSATTEDQAWSCAIDKDLAPWKIWMRHTNGDYSQDEKAWDDGNAFAQLKNQQQICGYNNWSMPTREQLTDLVDRDEWGELIWNDMSGSYGTYYWTSEEESATNAYRVADSSYSPVSTREKTDENYVKLVREVLNVSDALTELNRLHGLIVGQDLWSSSKALADDAVSQAQTMYDIAKAGTDTAQFQTALDTATAQISRVATEISTIQPQYNTLSADVVKARSLAASIALNADANADSTQQQQAAQLISEIDTAWTPLDQRYTSMLAATTTIGDLHTALFNANTAITARTALTDQLTALQTLRDQLQAQIDSITTATTASNAAEMVSLSHQMRAKLVEIEAKLVELQNANTALLTAQAAINAAEFVALNTNLTNQIDSANTTKQSADTQVTSSHTLADNTLNQAQTIGWPIVQADALIASSGFAKLDNKGRYIPADISWEQGWRCVIDTAHARAQVWSLMENGEKNGANHVAYDVAANANDAKRFLTGANSDQLCGYNDWSLPSASQLSALATVDGSSGKTINTDVFPQHQGQQSTFDSYNSNRYYYWTNGAENSGEVAAFSFATNSRGQAVYNMPADASWDGEDDFTFIRLVREDARLTPRYQKKDQTGSAAADDASWVCTLDDDTGLLWLKHQSDNGDAMSWTEANDTWVPQQNTDSKCGKTNWRLPTLEEVKTLPDSSQAEFADTQNNYYWTGTSQSSGYIVFNPSTTAQDWWYTSRTYPVRLVADQN